ncbi:MAG: AI-2E family transporter [Dermatophilaceae bacterium]
MRRRLLDDIRRARRAGPTDLPRTVLRTTTVSEPLSPGDPRRPAAWSVPLGVRTASEWAWRALLIAAAGYLVLYVLGLLSQVVIPIIVALLLAALLQPVYRFLARALPRALAALVTVIGTIGGVLGLLSFVGTQLVAQLDDITTQVSQGIDKIRRWARDSFGITDSQVDEWIDRGRDAISASNLTDVATAAGITAGHAVTGFFLALFTLFFFLYDGRTIWTWVIRLFPRTARERVGSSGVIAWAQLSAYTRATVLVAAVDAIGIGGGAALLGVPFPSGIALIVFFGAFIPIVGALISGSVAILLALVALGPVEALVMLGIVIGVQQIESHLLQPLLIGRAMRIHPLAVILAIAAGIVLAGIVGGLVAVPLVAVLNAVGHHLIDDEPVGGDDFGAAVDEQTKDNVDDSTASPSEQGQPHG